jgi:acyl-coenzyme A synthetase/AMP-(fatty) acid ligase
VENALLAHPAVIEAAVVGAADSDRMIKPKAIVAELPKTATGKIQRYKLR